MTAGTAEPKLRALEIAELLQAKLIHLTGK